jgi:hypothetical protein
MEQTFAQRLQRWVYSSSPTEVAKVLGLAALVFVAVICFTGALIGPFKDGTSPATFPGQALRGAVAVLPHALTSAVLAFVPAITLRLFQLRGVFPWRRTWQMAVLPVLVLMGLGIVADQISQRIFGESWFDAGNLAAFVLLLFGFGGLPFERSEEC